MATIFIPRTIMVRDKYKVKRQAFMAGTEVEEHVYHAVLATNAVINPQDLPKKGEKFKRSFASTPIETKDLTLEEVVVKSEEEAPAPKKRGRPKKAQ